MLLFEVSILLSLCLVSSTFFFACFTFFFFFFFFPFFAPFFYSYSFFCSSSTFFFFFFSRPFSYSSFSPTNPLSSSPSHSHVFTLLPPPPSSLLFYNPPFSPSLPQYFTLTPLSELPSSPSFSVSLRLLLLAALLELFLYHFSFPCLTSLLPSSLLYLFLLLFLKRG
jgi:hypothetical protein